MASDRTPSQQWQLSNGQAWVFVGRDGLVSPLVLAADVQKGGPTDMAALVAGLDHESYSFLSELRPVGRDLSHNGIRNVTFCGGG